VINGFKLDAQFYVVINKLSDECSCCHGSVDSASLGENGLQQGLKQYDRFEAPNAVHPCRRYRLGTS